MRCHLTYALVLGAVYVPCLPPLVAEPELVTRLDLGPDKSAVMEGFHALTPKTLYTPKRGFGWQPYGAGDWKKAEVDHQRPDPLWGDFIMMSGRSTRLRVDLPDGEYHLWFWTGQWGSDGWGFPPIQTCGLRSEDGGEVLRPMTLQQFLDENFRAQPKRWLTPNSDFYRNWIAPCFRRFDGTVAAKDGSLVIAPVRRFPLNAIVICPESDRDETERWLADLAQKQKASFECRNATPNVAEDFTPTDAEERAGLVLFLPQRETLVFPTSTPGDYSPRAEALTAFACPNETESLSLALRPLKRLDRMRVRMTELTGPTRIGGADVAAYRVQMIPRGARDLSYKYQGHLLRESTTTTLHANQTAQFWWDVRVPAHAPAGLYAGDVVVELNKGRRTPAEELARVPVRLRVLDMDLLSSDDTGVKLMVPYANFFGYHWLQTWALYRDLYWQDMRFMKARGLNTAMLAGDARPIGPTYAKLDRLPMSVLNVPFRRWQICRELGFKQVFWYGFQGLTSIGWRTADSNRFSKALGDEYCGPKHRAALRDIVKTMEQMRRERDLPPIIVSIMDEAICHGGARALPAYTKMVQYFAELKREYGIRFAVLDSSDEVDGYVKGLDICAPNRRGNAENFAKIDAVGAERWLYNTGLRRFQMGYYCWRAKLKGMWVWFYCDSRNCQLFPYGTRTSALAYQTPEGPVPTVHSAWVREGIDDLRYLRTLESYVRHGLSSNNAQAVAAAKKGQQVLDDLHSRMTDDFSHYVVNGPSGQPAPGAWHPTTLDVIRWKVAKHAIAIAEELRVVE